MRAITSFWSCLLASSITFEFSVFDECSLQNTSQKIGAFFYDILVCSMDWFAHFINLREVLQLLREHQLFSRNSKCTFGTIEIEYLGHIISKGLISMDATKVDSVLNWVTPTLVNELRGFLGLSNYYRRFIRHYRAMTKPLTTLLKKEVKWEWTNTTNDAFL